MPLTPSQTRDLIEQYVNNNALLAFQDLRMKRILISLQDNMDSLVVGAGGEPTIASGLTTQYWRGDKTWQVLNKTAVGLSNVQNVDTTIATNLLTGTIPAGRYGTGTIPVSAIAATGTLSSTNVLFGDGHWGAPVISDGTYGDIIVAGTTWTLVDASVGFGKLPNVDQFRVLGRVDPGSGPVTSLTGSDITPFLDVFNSTQPGIVTASGGGTTNFLRADGLWAAPGGSGSGTVNTGAANRLAYYPSSGTAVDDLAAITASRALISDSNGLPTHSAVTTTELGYLSGVTSAIQTQLNGKEPSLGNPSTNGYILSSTTAGVRSWIAPGGGSFTTEDAQDAVGAMVNTTLTYTDATPLLSINLGNANTWTADQSVPDEAYGVGWNGSLEVPTKNALYDKIETLTGVGGSLDATLAVGNTTGRVYNFIHDPAVNDFVRRITPNNYLTDYTAEGAEIAQRFNETLVRVDGVNPTSRPNYVWMFGYNQNSGGGRESTGDASIHLAIETMFNAGGEVFEMHWPQVTSIDGNMNRLMSWTIFKNTGFSQLYFTSENIDFRRMNGGAYYTAFAPNVFQIQHDGAATTFQMISPTGGAGGGLNFINDGTDAVIQATRNVTITMSDNTGIYLMPGNLAFSPTVYGYTQFVNNTGSTKFEFIGSDTLLGLRIEEGTLGITAQGLTIPHSAVDNNVKIGSIEFQSIGPNLSRFWENLYHDGTNTRLRDAGLGTYLNLNGGYNFYTAPSGAADDIVALTLRFQVTNTGDIFMPTIDNATEADVLYYDSATGKITYDTAPSGGGGGSNWTLLSGNVYRASGFVGVGLTAPATSFHAEGAYPAISLDATSGYTYMRFMLAGATHGLFGVAAAADNMITGSVANDFCIRSDQALLFSADFGTTIAMQINTTGALGFGTSFGTAGQVLTSAGTGAPPTWTTITPGTGDMILNATNTMGASGRILFPGSSTVNDFAIRSLSLQSPAAGVSHFSNNMFFNGTNYTYIGNGTGEIIEATAGAWHFKTFASGTAAGTTGTFASALLLDGTNGAQFGVSNAYLNFTTTAGSGGFGFRNNAGTMEFKNSGGSWAAFGGGITTAAGTYTPTVTITANATSPSASVCQYLRVGSTATVSGSFTVTVTAGSLNTTGTLTLPISSALASDFQLVGSCFSDSGNNIVGKVVGEATANEAYWFLLDLTASTHKIFFHLTYQII